MPLIWPVYAGQQAGGEHRLEHGKAEGAARFFGTLTNSAMVTALGIRAGYASPCVSNNYIYEFPVTAWPPSAGLYTPALAPK